jgi:hypothetical protein
MKTKAELAIGISAKTSQQQLLQGIQQADIQADKAWDNWDYEGYEGASATADRYFCKLVDLVGMKQAKAQVENLMYP